MSEFFAYKGIDKKMEVINQADYLLAAEAIRAYGKLYYLDICYPNTGDAILVKLKGLVPEARERLLRS